MDPSAGGGGRAIIENNVIYGEVGWRVNAKVAGIGRVEGKGQSRGTGQRGQVDLLPGVDDVILRVVSESIVRQLEIDRPHAVANVIKPFDGQQEPVGIRTVCPTELLGKSVTISH